jgi:hypothetical protein
MANYIEVYDIPGVGRFGVESRGGAFHVWTGGCGIGEVVDMAAARVKIFNYALRRLCEERKKAELRAQESTDALCRLGDDVWNLGMFRRPSDESPTSPIDT